MRRIKLTKGYTALVDNADYRRVMDAGPWHAFVDFRKGKLLNVYAVHSEYTKGSTPVTVRMHRFVMKLKPSSSIPVDHKDHDGLNNQKENLRLAKNGKNARNVRLYSNNTSGFKGVSLQEGKWKSTIRYNKKQIYLGMFTTKEKAARAYDVAARKLFGEFAYTNF
jgi:hypothetical protein